MSWKTRCIDVMAVREGAEELPQPSCDKLIREGDGYVTKKEGAPRIFFPLTVLARCRIARFLARPRHFRKVKSHSRVSQKYYNPTITLARFRTEPSPCLPDNAMSRTDQVVGRAESMDGSVLDVTQDAALQALQAHFKTEVCLGSHFRFGAVQLPN